MALTSSKLKVTKVIIHNWNKHLPLLGTRSQFYILSAKCSNSLKGVSESMSKAMKSYLEKSQKYEEFLKEQLEEFGLGKKHLANMMGHKNKNLTQEDIDKAIEYLFPSGLFIKRARPLMKPPSQIFPEIKSAEFGFTGRPFHHLFYTTKPNFSQLLHDAAAKLEELMVHEKLKRQSGDDIPEKSTLLLGGSEWLTKEELSEKLLEKLHKIDYDRFIEVFERLVEHPCSDLCKSFIMSYRKKTLGVLAFEVVEPKAREDGTLFVEIKGCKRKNASADVTLFYPGSGLVKINEFGIDYFINIESREQILFPLVFTQMLNKVDIEAKVNGGGDTSEAGAIRLGLSLALRSFVSADMVMKMKLAGLLQPDFRKAERKKVGKEGARRGYTWLKR